MIEAHSLWGRGGPRKKQGAGTAAIAIAGSDHIDGGTGGGDGWWSATGVAASGEAAGER